MSGERALLSGFSEAASCAGSALHFSTRSLCFVGAHFKASTLKQLCVFLCLGVYFGVVLCYLLCVLFQSKSNVFDLDSFDLLF